MKVKELIKLLDEFDKEKEVVYSSHGEMIHMSISNVRIEADYRYEKGLLVAIQGD